SLLTERNCRWETSTTLRESAASPEDFFSLIAAPNMTLQNVHAVQAVLGLVVSSSYTRSVLMRLPFRSSIHMRAPPAPQQKPRSLWRCISLVLTPGTLAMMSRGGVYTLLCRPRKQGSW